MAAPSEFSFQQGMEFASAQVMPVVMDAVAAIRVQATNAEQLLKPHLGEFSMPLVAGTSAVTLATSFWFLCRRRGGKKAPTSKKTQKKKPVAKKAKKGGDSDSNVDTVPDAVADGNVVTTGKKKNKKAKDTVAKAEDSSAKPVADAEVGGEKKTIPVEEDGWTVVPAPIKRTPKKEESPAPVPREGSEKTLAKAKEPLAPASQESSEKSVAKAKDAPAPIQASSEKSVAKEKVEAKPTLAPKIQTTRDPKQQAILDEFCRKIPGFN